MSLPNQEPKSTAKEDATNDHKKVNQVAKKAAEKAGNTEHGYDSSNDIFTK